MANNTVPAFPTINERLKFYQDLVETSQDIIWQCDQTGQFTYLNPVCALIFGYGLDEMIGRKFTEFQTPDMAERTMSRFMEILQGAGLKEFETVFTGKSGNAIHVTINSKCIQDEHGVLIGARGMAHDVTERIAAEQALRDGERELRRLYAQTQQDAIAKTELLNEVNHRVKNNLMMILGLILAEKRSALADGMHEVDATWIKFERRINGLLNVHQMLSDSHWKPINLGRLAERVCAGVLNSGLKTDQAVGLCVEASDIEVSPRQAGSIALVFNELITNCLKYAFKDTAHPAVRISTRVNAGRICIEFRDNGCGYPDEILADKQWGVGMRLIRQFIEQTLDGELVVSNHNGAVTLMVLGAETKTRT
jgi:PAS domain S-box-containing protein